MDNDKTNHASFKNQIRQKELQKIKALQKGGRSIWMGLGMFGLVGWSISIPTFLGAVFGMWLDEHYPGKFSYTLALLVAGLMLGCLNVFYWVGKENRQIHEDYSEKRNTSPKFRETKNQKENS